MLQRAGRSNNSAAKMRSTPVAGSQDSQSQIAGVVKDSASMVKDGFRFTRAGFKKDKMMTDEPQGLEGGGLLGPTGDADAEAEAFAKPTVDSRCSNWAPNERDQFEAYLTRRQADSKARRLQPEPEPEPEPQSGGSPRAGDEEGITASDSTSRFSVVVSGTGRGVADPFDRSVDSFDELANRRSQDVGLAASRGSNVGVAGSHSGIGRGVADPVDRSVGPFDDLANRHSQDVGLAASRESNIGVVAAGGHGSGSTDDAVVDSVPVGNLIDL
jgi:hypothetical protein